MADLSGAVGFLRKSGAFLVVGGAAFVVDAVVFNLLTFGFTGRGPLYDAAVVAKVIAIAVATVVTYVGNRYWTFGTRTIARKPSRYIVFILLNVIAMGIQVGCLAFSRHVLGLEGVVADNVSGTLIGQALATIFRFFTYDRWVFPDDAKAARRVALEAG
ncbi:GtrA family protein [Microbacterium aurum]